VVTLTLILHVALGTVALINSPANMAAPEGSIISVTLQALEEAKT